MGRSVLTQDLDEGGESEGVTAPAQADDLTDADRGEDGEVAKFFAVVDVGEVDFDAGFFDGGDGVAQGVGVVGRSAYKIGRINP